MFQLGPVLLLLFAVSGSGSQLLWNDPSIAEGPCTYPTPIPFPQHIVDGISSYGQGFKLYLGMANAAYYRWQYQKAMNTTPATTQAQLDSLQPRVFFPNVPGVLSLTEANVTLFNPPSAYYALFCVPADLLMTNVTCVVKNASPGSAPKEFGLAPGKLVATTCIWADDTAFAEWHCFEGSRPVFNVLHLNPVLTPDQISAITQVVTSMGFKRDNIQFQNYA